MLELLFGKTFCDDKMAFSPKCVSLRLFEPGVRVLVDTDSNRTKYNPQVCCITKYEDLKNKMTCITKIIL